MQRVIGGVQHHFVSRMPEWVMAGLLLMEGWVLLEPGITLASTKAYAPLRAVCDENTLGFFAVSIGSVWLIALVLNGTFTWFRRISPWTRAGCCLANATFMSVFTFGMRLGNPSGDGYLVHGGWMIMALVYCAIIAPEVRLVDKEAKLRWKKPKKHRIGIPS